MTSLPELITANCIILQTAYKFNLWFQGTRGQLTDELAVLGANGR